MFIKSPVLCCGENITFHQVAKFSVPLQRQITHYITDDRVICLVEQYLYYCVDDGGEIHTPETGIPRGCALSPLLGGSLLYHIDAEFNATEDIYYARYMDDFILLTRTRWRLRQSVVLLNEFLDWGGFKQHPDKTYIGKISRGMDWLGAQFDEHGATGVADRALRHHRDAVSAAL
ncbi:reverse transcriptase domain-containing protein [Escherichia coli]|uniref:reverse transcriptase domain-containing protein n=3 Tax=Escherichia coli TaxID=562 RepID=UPI0008FEFC49|nr:reverse transcriptase domain-containing protein [Escherichia coli]